MTRLISACRRCPPVDVSGIPSSTTAQIVSHIGYILTILYRKLDGNKEWDFRFLLDLVIQALYVYGVSVILIYPELKGRSIGAQSFVGGLGDGFQQNLSKKTYT